MPLTPIGDALSRRLDTKGALRGQVTAAQVLEHAQAAIVDLLGAELAPQAKPLFLKNRTLTISCSSSSVAQEIRLKQSQIVDYINQKLGEKEVDRIRYLA